jgi:hypothetical protein
LGRQGFIRILETSHFTLDVIDAFGGGSLETPLKKTSKNTGFYTRRRTIT